MAAAERCRDAQIVVHLSGWYATSGRYVVPWSSLRPKHAPPGPGKSIKETRVFLPDSIEQVGLKASGNKLPELYKAVADAYDPAQNSKQQTFAAAVALLHGRAAKDEDYVRNTIYVYVHIGGMNWS